MIEFLVQVIIYLIVFVMGANVGALITVQLQEHFDKEEKKNDLLQR